MCVYIGIQIFGGGVVHIYNALVSASTDLRSGNAHPLCFGVTLHAPCQRVSGIIPSNRVRAGGCEWVLVRVGVIRYRIIFRESISLHPLWGELSEGTKALGLSGVRSFPRAKCVLQDLESASTAPVLDEKALEEVIMTILRAAGPCRHPNIVVETKIK